MKRAQISLKFTLFTLHTLMMRSYNVPWGTHYAGQKLYLIPTGPCLHILDMDLQLNFLMNKMVENGR